MLQPLFLDVPSALALVDLWPVVVGALLGLGAVFLLLPAMRPAPPLWGARDGGDVGPRHLRHCSVGGVVRLCALLCVLQASYGTHAVDHLIQRADQNVDRMQALEQRFQDGADRPSPGEVDGAVADAKDLVASYR